MTVEGGGQGQLGLRRRGADQVVVALADGGGVVRKGFLELGYGAKAHEPRQTLLRPGIGGDAVGLAVVLHLQAMFHGAEEDVGMGELAGVGFLEQIVLDQFFEGGKGLVMLKEGEPAPL